jgi:hypothetical protein
MKKQATFQDAVQDARILASLFYKMKSGMETWYKVFTSLENKYTPFLIDIFRDEFYHHISQQGNFDKLMNEVWGEL